MLGGEPALIVDTAQAGLGPLGTWVLLGQARMLGIQLLLQVHQCRWESPVHRYIYSGTLEKAIHQTRCRNDACGVQFVPDPSVGR